MTRSCKLDHIACLSDVKDEIMKECRQYYRRKQCKSENQVRTAAPNFVSFVVSDKWHEYSQPEDRRSGRENAFHVHVSHTTEKSEHTPLRMCTHPLHQVREAHMCHFVSQVVPVIYKI